MQHWNLYLAPVICSVIAWNTVEAHPEAIMHIRDMSAVFEGYGQDEGFRKITERMSTGIDHELPRMFREKIGPLPANHRILGHAWSLDGPIDRETLNMLERAYPGRKADIMRIWADWVNDTVKCVEQATGLPKTKAKSLAALLLAIHQLGDLEPDNSLLDSVKDLPELAKDIKKQIGKLLGEDSPRAKQMFRMIDERMQRQVLNREQQLARLIRNGVCADAEAAGKHLLQQTARQLMTDLQSSGLGGLLEEIGGKRMKILRTEKAIAKATAIRSLRAISNLPGVSVGKAAELALEHEKGLLPKGAREMLMRSCKRSALSASFSSIVQVEGLITKEGALWIPAIKSGISEAGMVFVMDAGIASYQYAQGKIHRPQLERELQDAAIKGLVCGGSSVAVTLILGSNPSGWVVLGIGVAGYFITDLSLQFYHRWEDGKKLTARDLEIFLGIPDEPTFLSPEKWEPDKPSPLKPEEWDKGKPSALKPEEWDSDKISPLRPEEWDKGQAPPLHPEEWDRTPHR